MYVNVTETTEAPLPSPEVVDALETAGCQLIGRVEWVDADSPIPEQERALPAAVLATAERDAFVLLESPVRGTPAPGEVRSNQSLHLRSLMSNTTLLETIARYPLDPSAQYAALRKWNDLVPKARNRLIRLVDLDDPGLVVQDHLRRVALHRELISPAPPVAHDNIDMMLMVWGLADAHRHLVNLRMGKILRYGRLLFLAAMTVVAVLVAAIVLAVSASGQGRIVALAAAVTVMGLSWRGSRRVADEMVTMAALHPLFAFKVPTAKTGT